MSENTPVRLFRRSRKGTINLFGECRVRYFEYFYMFVMVLYMAQMTGDTGRMVGSLSGNPIPLLLPIVLTVILLMRHKIHWGNRNLWLLTGATTVWSLAILIKYNAFTSSSEWSYIFFLYYAIFIAFIHVKVYKRSLFPLYEHIMVWLCRISLVMWVLNILLYHAGLFADWGETNLGRNILYLYQWLTPDKARNDTFYLTLRNPGCSWEPGRFSIMVLLAIFVNLCRKGVRFRKNHNIWWLLAALLSTQSTTGYSIALLMYALFYVKKFNLKTALGFCAIIIPIAVFLTQAEFMGSKISSQLQEANVTDEFYEQVEWNAKNVYAEGEYANSLGRFESIYFEWQNFRAAPLLGYGRNTEHSLFYKDVSTNYSLTGGLVKLIAQYGVFYAALLYLILFLSSARIAATYHQRRPYVLFLTIVLSTISYVVWCVPIFTAFWLYGLFSAPLPKGRSSRVQEVQEFKGSRVRPEGATSTSPGQSEQM